MPMGNPNIKQAGTSLVEALVAFGILTAVVTVFLGGLSTSLRGTFTAKEQVVAESLTRSELDYIKSAAYSISGYSINPDLDLRTSEGWSLQSPLVQTVQDGLQKITVTAEHNGIAVYSISTYKMRR